MYQTILKRKSTRKYKNIPLEEKDKAFILDKIKTLKPLFSNLNYEIILASKKEVVSNMANDFILFYGRDEEEYAKLNCGYMLSQMDLFLNENGYGSCYIGTFKTSKKIKGFDYMLMLAVGYPEKPPYRESEAEFKRLDISRVLLGDTQEEIKKAVRLCPSANNFQPWLVKAKDNKLEIYINKKSAISILAKSFFEMDIGILLNHIENALNFLGKTASFVDEKLPSAKNEKYKMTVVF